MCSQSAPLLRHTTGARDGRKNGENRPSRSAAAYHAVSRASASGVTFSAWRTSELFGPTDARPSPLPGTRTAIADSFGLWVSSLGLRQRHVMLLSYARCVSIQTTSAAWTRLIEGQCTRQAMPAQRIHRRDWSQTFGRYRQGRCARATSTQSTPHRASARVPGWLAQELAREMRAR